MASMPNLQQNWKLVSVMLVFAVCVAGCGGGGEGGAIVAVPGPVPQQAVPNNSPQFLTGLGVAPTALGSGGGVVNFNVQVADPDNDALTVAVTLTNATTGQLLEGARLTLQNGVFTGSVNLDANGSTVGIAFNVFVEATDNRIAAPIRQDGPPITVQGLVGPPPAPSLNRIIR